MNMNITPDIIFSYWIYAWSILYYIILVKKMKTNITSTSTSSFIKYANPTILLYFALIENICSLFYIFLSTFDFSISFLYIVMLLLLKVLTIYLLRHAPINIPINVLLSTGIFLLYVIYVQGFRKISVMNLYRDIYKSIILRENKTPFFWIYHKLFYEMR